MSEHHRNHRRLVISALHVTETKPWWLKLLQCVGEMIGACLFGAGFVWIVIGPGNQICHELLEKFFSR